MQVSVYRYNPENDSEPYMQDFTVEIPGNRDLMVLDVLELLKGRLWF
jgi:succinate dehydrogenase / fumarate reductase iron-sulfur subunit